MEKEKKPHPIDVHVGNRVRLRRSILGMSQNELGSALGLTFQQVQKYEKGVNRIGASRVFEISRILKVPIQFLFDDFDLTNVPTGGFAEGGEQDIDGSGSALIDLLKTPEGVELCRHFAKIEEPKIRKRVLDLVKTLSEGGTDEM